MSDEPKNRTEQWLKAYAKRRREELGDPPAMHEATRQMLQGEIRRTYGSSANAPEPAAQPWPAFLRWAVSGLAAMGVGLLALSIFNQRPATPTKPQDNPGTMAKVTLPEPQNADEQDKAKLAGEAADQMRVGKNTESAKDQDEKRLSKKDDDASSGGAGIAAAALKPRVFRAQATPGAMNMRAAARNLAGNVQTYNLKEKKFAQTIQPKPLKVLQNLELTQNNGQVTIKDADGSVYKGRVMLAAANLPILAQASKRQGNNGLNNAGGAGGGAPTGAPGRRPNNPIISRPPVGTSPAGKTNPATPAPSNTNLLDEPAPPHDMVAKSWPIEDKDLLRPIDGSNARATSEGGAENVYRNFQGKSVWYSYTATQPVDLSISTQGSNFDTTLGVFIQQGALLPAPTAKPYWNDNTGNTPQSKVLLTCVPGTTYLIAVDGKGGATGKIKLMLRKRGAASVTTARNTHPLFYFNASGRNITTGQLVDFDGFLYQHGAPLAIRDTQIASKKTETNASEKLKERGREDMNKSATIDGRLRIQGRYKVGGQELALEADTAPAPLKKD